MIMIMNYDHDHEIWEDPKSNKSKLKFSTFEILKSQTLDFRILASQKISIMIDHDHLLRLKVGGQTIMIDHDRSS